LCEQVKDISKGKKMPEREAQFQGNTSLLTAQSAINILLGQQKNMFLEAQNFTYTTVEIT